MLRSISAFTTIELLLTLLVTSFSLAASSALLNRALLTFNLGRAKIKQHCFDHNWSSADFTLAFCDLSNDTSQNQIWRCEKNEAKHTIILSRGA